jgi:hypothetical protein
MVQQMVVDASNQQIGNNCLECNKKITEDCSGWAHPPSYCQPCLRQEKSAEALWAV